MLIKNKIIFIIIYIFAFNLSAKSFVIEIIGNDHTDTDVVYSLLENKPESLNTDYSNYLLKQLNQSGLFKNVRVEMNTDKYIIYVEEYPSINKIYYKNNKRLKDEDFNMIETELNIVNLNPNKIHKFIEQIKEIYKSFGYNQIKIESKSEVHDQSNTANLYLEIYEGEITKIKNIYFVGNSNFDSVVLRGKIKSKIKSLSNIFANNNFKLFQIKNDAIRIENFYKNNGFIDVNVNFDIEYQDKKNKTFIYFRISEGLKYNFRKIAPIKDLAIGFGVQYQSSRIPWFTRSFEVPAFTIFDTAIYYEPSNSNIEIALNIGNLFNTTYWLGAQNYLRLFPGAPRNASLAINYRF